MKVKCIDNLNGKVSLTIGKEYNVIRTNEIGWYWITNDIYEDNYYRPEQFEIITETKNDYTGKKVKIINVYGFEEVYHNPLEKYINQTGVIIKDHSTTNRFIIKFDDENISKMDIKNGRLLFELRNLQFIEESETKPKPPLGVMPKNIYEEKRIQELSRALHEYIEFGSQDYELLSKWAEELYDRINNLKYMSEE